MRAMPGVIFAAMLAAPGCIGLDLSRDTVAPQAGQWEYLTLRPEAASIALASVPGPQTDPELARLGAEGWELAAVNDGAYILKRLKKQ